MKVRVITLDGFSEFCEDMGLDIDFPDLTDEQFMNIYEMEGSDWEFDSLEAFAEAFNANGDDAPMPESHIIRFFPNE